MVVRIIGGTTSSRCFIVSTIPTGVTVVESLSFGVLTVAAAVVVVVVVVAELMVLVGIVILNASSVVPPPLSPTNDEDGEATC